MSKPLAISDLLKEKKKPATYPGILTSNKFQALAEKTKGRERSLSVKRFRMDEEEDDEEEGCETGDGSVFDRMEKAEELLKGAREVIEQVKKDSDKIAEENPLKAVVEATGRYDEVDGEDDGSSGERLFCNAG